MCACILGRGKGVLGPLALVNYPATGVAGSSDPIVSVASSITMFNTTHSSLLSLFRAFVCRGFVLLTLA